MAKVFVSRKIPGKALQTLLDSGHEVKISPFDRPLTRAEAIEMTKGADAFLLFLTDKVDGEFLDAVGSQLKVVSNYAVGFDNITISEATKRGVVVSNTPSDEVNESVAEHTWALLLALVNRIVEGDEAVRKGAYHGWEPELFLGRMIVGKTLGIIGLGRIGSMVARRARGYNLEVLYFNRSKDEKAEQELGVKYTEFNELLAKSDFVTLHIPLTEETRHMINKEILAKFKRGAYLVNTARGPIVDEHALVAALRDGQLAGAALDVFDNEPNVNAELISMPNVILTPHIASATWEAREKMSEQAVAAILDTLASKKPETIVNPEVWESRRK